MRVGMDPGPVFVTSYTHDLPATHASLGGPFLLGHTTVAEPMENGQIQVDGQLALTASPS